MMPKVHLAHAGHGLYMFYCPGCHGGHGFYTKPFKRDGKDMPNWTFNSDVENPTFSPSLMVNQGTVGQCHLHLVNGNIQFADDCDHALAGHIVACPEWEE